jgi:hypothetical protein
MQNKHGLRFTIPFRHAGYVGKIWSSSTVALTNKPQFDSIQQVRGEPNGQGMPELGRNPNPSSALCMSASASCGQECAGPCAVKARACQAKHSASLGVRLSAPPPLNVMCCPQSSVRRAVVRATQRHSHFVPKPDWCIAPELYAIRLPGLRRSTDSGTTVRSAWSRLLRAFLEENIWVYIGERLARQTSAKSVTQERM